MKQEISALEMLLDLAKQRKDLEENISRLDRMRGKDVDGVSRCEDVRFYTGYGAAMFSGVVDPDFNELMVNTAINYYADRVKGIDFLLGLAERAVVSQLGSKITNALEELQKLNQKQKQD